MVQAKTGKCLCPNPDRHPEGETVYFKDEIGFRELAAVDRAVALARQFEAVEDDAEIWARVSEFYLLHFIERWTVTNKAGEVIPSNVANVREFLIKRHPLEALNLADRADELFSESVFVPLVLRARQLPPPGPTGDLALPDTSKTSEPDAPLATVGGGPRGRSRRSSITTTPTDAIVTTP